MKLGFCVEQGMHALFECPEDVNEIPKITPNRFLVNFA